MNEMYLPSGEMRAYAFSGVPNNAVRGITGVFATAWAAGPSAAKRVGATTVAAKTPSMIFPRETVFML
jgi:hypothetical protein